MHGTWQGKGIKITGQIIYVGKGIQDSSIRAGFYQSTEGWIDGWGFLTHWPKKVILCPRS